MQERVHKGDSIAGQALWGMVKRVEPNLLVGWLLRADVFWDARVFCRCLGGVVLWESEIIRFSCDKGYCKVQCI